MEREKAIQHAQKEILSMELFRKEALRVLLIFFILSNVFLFLRIVLRAFGADPINMFAAFIYFISGIILLPVFGIFRNSHDSIIGGQPAFDFSAFIALFCYNILVLMAMGLLQIVCSMIKANKQVTETLQKGKPADTRIVDRALGNRHI